VLIQSSASPRFEVIDRVENYLYDVRIRLTMPGTVDERIVNDERYRPSEFRLLLSRLQDDE